MTECSLDLIGRTLLALRDEVREFRREVDDRFDRVEARLTAFERNDQVMRYAGEHIAWGAMERQINQLLERMDEIETHLPPS